ncbi:MAG: hypothetical protein A2509_10730 [Candidatus Edwardsbacteria bacterium RIFOXYD12_FULL_50_11]|jgi:hypothetical protein|uniref:Uncharacterized protein n=1 Tax=Candidatus Edwardsbacteria bacterium GWF2_54_11 TaxID=1817851 RepID=A0A1F5RJ83_9BACT|nr:MAG: hypothetical protein A2502_01460 [Candidatus Edwardsbacteria bacterium RifOxyC12_full_54_24]OGF08535.1 MAG: hypothetical protein A2273_06235 [Candidatus Edwardsbacteria bacterium RifOxyA12_full_54_48]OGF11401.1 MAG: hypothetical protein A3K15_03520 [Candidatus Edwardsbacteria bacterium GWE2_54_12]OGF14449.1 MAG: hypothetical protein A2024_10025 [Candidatus Edwardsbacteria bacterium GWF2_54_11]OGF16377.1 MAG: hypothetical protein A2509_10730 [Candidatus Edwardsbacteria bacterium RIFOXYD1
MAKKVRNINGTPYNTCSCGSWLAHWEKYSGRIAVYCSEAGCANQAEAGGHVLRVGANDDNWYIIPLCAEHNSLTGRAIEVIDATIFVPANVEETCGSKGQG